MIVVRVSRLGAGKQLRVTCELCFDFLSHSVLHDVEVFVFHCDETTVIRNADIEG